MYMYCHINIFKKIFGFMYVHYIYICNATSCPGSGEGAAGDGGVARRDAWGGGGARGGGGGYKGASPQFRILNSEH